MSNKGVEFGFLGTIVGLILIGFILYLIFYFFARYFDISTIVKEAEDYRKKITLAQILLSSDMLVYSDGNRIYRGVLDKNKLDNIDSDALFTEISYPGLNYGVKITDLDTGKTWTVGSGRYYKKFPVAIRSGDDIHVGMLEVGFA